MPLQANSAAARDVAYYLHPYTNLKANEDEGPLVITEGKGIYVYDENGREYIEGFAGLWCTALGFSEPRLIEAAIRQFRRLPYYHSFFQRNHDSGIDLAEKLIQIAPVMMSKVFFTTSGSEANDTAVKLIWYYNNALDRPRKKKIISRQNAYHGVTIASASLTGLPNNHRDFDLPLPNFLHTNCPHYYRYAKPGESEDDFAARMAEDLEQMILAEGPDTVAAFIAEPVMGGGGIIVPPSTYFDRIQPVLRKYDVLFIADEVICGFGRTGNMWGCQTFKLKPDMITMAKALTSGYLPLGAVMISESIYQALVKESEKIGIFGHGYTYTGHPICTAVALEALKIYDEKNIVQHVRRVGARFQEGFRRLADHPLVGEVRGVGLLAAMTLVKDKVTKEPFPPTDGVGAYLGKRAQEHGLITRAWPDGIGLAPPLIVTEAEIDEILARVGRALEDTTSWIRAQGLAKVA